MGIDDARGRFESELRATGREGVDGLLEWLGSTDFYRAPASTRFHGAHEGGLVEHCLSVLGHLRDLASVYPAGVGDDSIVIASLLHDVCKADCYRPDFRNVKGDDGVWRRVPCYRFEEQFAFGGHGSKSVYLVQNFIRLTPDEAVAINCHMGAYDAGQYSSTSEAYGRCRLAWLLHVADEASTFVDEI